MFTLKYRIIREISEESIQKKILDLKAKIRQRNIPNKLNRSAEELERANGFIISSLQKRTQLDNMYM